MVLFQGVECYGDLDETSNFAVLCEDENDDCVWCDGLPEGEIYTWTNVVAFLSQMIDGDIVEISAV